MPSTFRIPKAPVTGLYGRFLTAYARRTYGQVPDGVHETVQTLFAAIAQTHDFQVVTNHLILFGYCSRCQENVEG